MSNTKQVNAKQMLEAAWKLIEDPNHRCIESFAQDSKGNQVHPGSPKAVCFCSDGALKAIYFKAGSPSTFYYAESALTRSSAELGYSSIFEANDADVINNPPKLFTRAIEIVSNEQI